MDKTMNPKTALRGEVKVPGDKSISHRAVMFGAIADGVTEIDGFLEGEDCLSTIECFRKMGVEIHRDGSHITVHGKGMRGLSAPEDVLDVGNSGTTIRLMSGILAAQPFTCHVTGDASIHKRPMDRIINPLSQMGANISGTFNATGKTCAPLTINGKGLSAISYKMPVASAQVKSAILLASLYAEGRTEIIEQHPSRNHSELMLRHFGANITTEVQPDGGVKIISEPTAELHGQKISVPGDISSAAYFIAAALIVPDSHLTILGVGINETRTGIIDAFHAMGGDIEIINIREVCGERVGDIVVKSSKLKATELCGNIIPRMIDEIPVFAVAALFAEGRTIVRDAQELKVKESNRIATMAAELAKMGATITETDDGMIIEGGQKLHGAAVFGHDDHRVAMSMAVAALMADGATVIEGADCVGISFPDFFELFSRL